jgi:hypothetical protein
MRLIRSHKTLAIVLAIAVAWIIYRVSKGLAVLSAGHSSPEDAISYGWAVTQAGITGWHEVSPDGSQSIMHDTGWTQNPYTNATDPMQDGTLG